MNNNIKAVVLDIDGVLIGKKENGNPSMPTPEILESIKKINQKIPVFLCTGRPLYTLAAQKIISDAKLDNFHISDMGGLISNPVSSKVLDAWEIDKKACLAATRMFLKEKLYTVIFTPQNYINQKDQVNYITGLLSEAIETEPFMVESLLDEIARTQVLRFLVIAKDKKGESKIKEIASAFSDKLNLLWGCNPNLPSLFLADIPPVGISKAPSLKRLLDHCNIPMENALGVGDGNIDWDFMKLCGYCATLEDALESVKQNVSAINDSNRAFIGGEAGKNGIIDIFRHFGLTK